MINSVILACSSLGVLAAADPPIPSPSDGKFFFDLKNHFSVEKGGDANWGKGANLTALVNLGFSENK
jgi:hypothetical protein